MTLPGQVASIAKAQGGVRGNRGRWAPFLICLVAWTLSNLDQALFGYALPGILAEFNLPLTAAGLILTISFVAASILVILAGMAADRFGRGNVLGVLLAVSALFVGLQGFAGTIVLLTLFRALGFGLGAGLSPITNTIVAETSPPRLRGLAMGLLQCGYPIGWLLASLVAAPLLNLYGWRAACFVAFGVVPLAALIWFLLRLALPEASAAEPQPRQEAPRAKFSDLLAPAYRKNSITCAVTFFLFGGAYAGSAFFFPTFFAQQRGYSAADAAWLVGLSNGLAVIGYISAAVVGEFLLTRRNTFSIWCFGGAIALLGLLWLADSRGEDLGWYAVTAALFYGAMAVLPVLVAEIFPPEIRATALAACASAPLSLGFAVFPVVVPLVVTWMGWEAGLSVVVLPLLVLAAVAALFLPNRKSGEPLA